ncbi:DNA mismatch repair endonuclease MutL [Anaerovorax odorimutans]|uniref:DNA mismatch repair endonuclease MutL n=1 Tax=Anaerovorax odorimutans TaxID=109327 RepID=UPI0004032F6C|nr:DNA mismatch repair endonuclease MutL [Anaerovorax odorimutans]
MDKKINKIIKLPKIVADKIAAGEVVDRPLSIVKELVENAIDAGSDSIIIEFKNGGKSYIRVTDNGHGIDKEDVEIAFTRHATSKIKLADDLDHITSLGFRGEALASIAAVSKVELITKTANEKSGISIKIEGGEIAEKIHTGCPEGTTIIVRDLFYNTPARLKFMKTDSTESTLIIDFVSKLSLAYPKIKIRLINNGNILFSTPGKNNIYTNILTIYNKEIGNHLLHFKEENDNISLEGYISVPSYSKSNRKSQIFFVNGRYINSKIIENAVMDGYAEKLFEKRYPIAFLFIKVMPEKLDVNIHPNKKEVRFDDEKLIKDFITAAIRNSLNTKEAIPEVKVENIFKLKNTNKKDAGIIDIKISDNKNIQENTQKEAISIKEEQVDIKKILSNKREIERKMKDSPDNDNNSVSIKSTKGNVELSKSDTFTYEKNIEEKQAEKEFLALESDNINISYTEKPIKNPFNFEMSDIRTNGAIFNTYITGVDDNNFFLIDQHAAHERIFYEQLMSQYEREEKFQQDILIPFVVNVTFAAKNDSYNWLGFLRNIGYDINEFGAKAFIIKGIPMFMELDEAKDFLDDFLDNIDQGTDFKDQKKIDKIIMNSCKKAIKAHDYLDQKEIDRLMKDLAKCKNPYSCPHGRPTFIKISKYEIEKMFKRV